MAVLPQFEDLTAEQREIHDALARLDYALTMNIPSTTADYRIEGLRKYLRHDPLVGIENVHRVGFVLRVREN